MTSAGIFLLFGSVALFCVMPETGKAAAAPPQMLHVTQQASLTMYVTLIKSARA